MVTKLGNGRKQPQYVGCRVTQHGKSKEMLYIAVHSYDHVSGMVRMRCAPSHQSFDSASQAPLGSPYSHSREDDRAASFSITRYTYNRTRNTRLVDITSIVQKHTDHKDPTLHLQKDTGRSFLCHTTEPAPTNPGLWLERGLYCQIL